MATVAECHGWHRDPVAPLAARTAGVGVERFEVAALTFVEQDVECQRRLARARDTGHDAEAAAGDLDVDILQIVLARAAHHDLTLARIRWRCERFGYGADTGGLAAAVAVACV